MGTDVKQGTSRSIRVGIVSRAVRRSGRMVDILGSRVQFGNLFLAGSPDHRMPDEGGPGGSFSSYARPVRVGNYFGIN